MSIRRAVAEDIDALVALNADLHEIHHRADPQRYVVAKPDAVADFFRKQLAREDAEIWLAERDGRPIGYALLLVENRVSSAFTVGGRIAMVDQLGVSADARGEGIGTELMEWVHARARELGCEQVALDVAGFNAGARRFYERLGYSELRVRMVRRA